MGVIREIDFTSLQEDLARVDFLNQTSKGNSSGFMELLLKFENLKIKMYQEPKHHRAHIHIDYGRKNHIASYAVDNGKRLNGSLHRKYDKSIYNWIEKNREQLFKIWESLQEGNLGSSFIKELSAI